MRIGLISGEYPPQQGGVGAYTRILGLTLADAGHEVFVLAGPSAHEDDPRLTLDRVSAWKLNAGRLAERWAKHRQLDAVNLQYQTAAFNMSPWVHFLPGRVHSAPVAVTFHDLRFPYLFPKAGPLRPWIVRHLAKSADGVIATNPEDFERLRGLPHAALIPIGSNIAAPVSPSDPAAARQRFGIGRDEPLLVYFGLLNRGKGLNELVDALELLRGNGLAVRLLAIGSAGSSDPTNQAYEAELHARVAAACLNEAVTFTGFLPDDEVDALLRAADAVALPFLDGASMRRGSLMAALRAGCAIVTTTPAVPTPGFTDDAALRLVPPNDAPALAAALRQVLEDPALRAKLQVGAATLARQFEWPAIAASVAGFLETIIAGWRHS
ncbi:MAG: glycosyltransferase family 4 protein [Anaerolineae bacterium]|nr:glycosyltransferase family 4 protein [Anaerolineae bacterium]